MASIAAYSSDPQDYRMSFGQHLEELRRRVLLGLLGLGVALAITLIFGRRVVATFCAPLVEALQAYDINPQVYFTQISDPFMVYLKISLITAVAIASPWLLYQLWQFVAAGLYPKERRYVTRYMPLSVGLLIVGMLFVYFLVLPMTLRFFVGFSEDFPLKLPNVTSSQPSADLHGIQVPVLQGDPAAPQRGELWFNEPQGRLVIHLGNESRVVLFAPNRLMAPLISLPEYIDLVLGMLLAFGLSFQLPLVVLALVRIGIFEVDALRRSRRYVYFAITVLAAMITPGDVLTATVAMMVPLILLFELGIYLSTLGGSQDAQLQE